MNVSKAQQFSGFLDSIEEKWGTDYETPEKKKGMWDNWSQADLHSELSKLKSQGPHDKDSAKATRMKQINFALRAKHNWGKAD